MPRIKAIKGGFRITHTTEEVWGVADPCNKDRREYARRALVAYRAARHQGEPDEGDARDLITDLLHLLRKGGADTDAEMRMAVSSFNAEESEEAEG